jgi:hypothetical protein
MPTNTWSALAEHTGRWTVPSQFLDALTRRDFPALADCLSATARLRAVTPMRELDLTGATLISERFRMWFGDAAEFDVVDASLGEVGTRIYLRWRIRTRGRDGANPPELVEQHVFATVGEQIESLDLLCSGFQPLVTETVGPTQ